MDAYIYKGELLCEDCGEKQRNNLKQDPDTADKVPANPADERTVDSDDFPKGPYPDGGGEADHPQHCDMCLTFLANPLTEDGSAYVKQRFKDGKLTEENLAAYEAAYPAEFSEAREELELDAAPGI